jgi:cell wall-associated NlpC family hydrolase
MTSSVAFAGVPVPARVTEIRARLAPPTASSDTARFETVLAGARLAATPVPSAAATTTTTALAYVGAPYVWGGNDPATGLDCSGFTKLVFGSLGVSLPRVSTDQATAGAPVASMADARPGDLLAFGSPVDHVAIYMGDGRMVHAAGTGKGVRIDDVYRTPTAIRRLTPDQREIGVPA